MNRRQFVQWYGLTAALAALPVTASSAGNRLKPPRLRPGDVAALVAPATVNYDQLRVELAVETLEAMGLEVVVGKHVLDRFGYLAGTDADRAADLNNAFADPDVKAIFPLTGGWGASRLLPLLDYRSIGRNPKVLMGYSDITSLLNGIHARTGLVTFHGPNAWSEWNEFSYQSMHQLLFQGKSLSYSNTPEKGEDLVAKRNRIQTINGGIASGEMIGGNLTLVAALSGTPFLPAFEGRILLLEDVGEAIYRVDRMLTQLSLAGQLQRLSGIVFGQFKSVAPEPGLGNFSLMDILRQHCEPLGIPCYYGAMFGHVEHNSTLPIGIHATMDADAGTIKLDEPAVS